MATDDIQTISTATGVASDTLAQQGTGVPVSADTLERWTRAVTAPVARNEQNADTPAASAKAESSQPAQAERQPGLGRLDALAQRGPSAPPQTGRGDALSSPEAPVNIQSRANALRADARAADASSAQTPAATPSRGPANQQAAFGAADPAGAESTLSTPATTSSTTALLSSDAYRSADASITAQGAPTRAREPAVRPHSETPTPGDKFAGTAETALWSQPVLGQNEFASMEHKEIAGLHGEVPSRSDDTGGKAITTAWSAQPALAQNEVAGARALPLSELRGLHANHRQSRFDASLLDSPQSETSATQQVNTAVNADLLMPRVQAHPSMDARGAADGVAAVGGNEQLHALIESCCSRLWVNDGGSRAAQGVMLDLGRWMPGCTVEVAKAAGVLRITLRGVDGAERARLEDELQGLGDGLADKLGCKVVAAVATNKELT
jgi:hypothetical protein